MVLNKILNRYLLSIIVICISLNLQATDNKIMNNNVQIDIEDKTTIDMIGLYALKPKINELKNNKNELFNWYINSNQKLVDSFMKVKDDEFEVEDFKNKAYTDIINKINNVENFIGKESSFLLNVEFGEFNFDSNSFPISLLNKNSYVTFNGKSFLGSIELSFNNTNSENAYLEMEKLKAKEFIKSRKNTYGTVNRKLHAKYYFTIIKIDEYKIDRILRQTNFDKWTGSRISKIDSYLKVVGHINKIELLDNNKLLKTFTFEKANGNDILTEEQKLPIEEEKKGQQDTNVENILNETKKLFHSNVKFYDKSDDIFTNFDIETIKEKIKNAELNDTAFYMKDFIIYKKSTNQPYNGVVYNSSNSEYLFLENGIAKTIVKKTKNNSKQAYLNNFKDTSKIYEIKVFDITKNDIESKYSKIYGSYMDFPKEIYKKSFLKNGKIFSAAYLKRISDKQYQGELKLYYPQNNQLAYSTKIIQDKDRPSISYDDTKVDGEFKVYGTNGEILILGNFNNGLPEGRFIMYYSNGMINTIENYSQGNLNGIKLDYYPNNQLFNEGTFENNQVVGINKVYNKDGLLIQTTTNGFGSAKCYLESIKNFIPCHMDAYIQIEMHKIPNEINEFIKKGFE